MPSEVKMVLQDKEEYLYTEEEDDESELLDDDNSGQSLYDMKYENGVIYFQKSEWNVEEPVEIKLGTGQDQPLTPGQPQLQLNPNPVSDIREVKVKLIKDMTSPMIQGTFNHTKVTALVDEGSGTNAIDETFSTKHKIRVVPTSRIATGAGNNQLKIVGETENDLVIDTKFGLKHVSVNLGRATVISQLDSDIIIESLEKWTTTSARTQTTK